MQVIKINGIDRVLNVVRDTVDARDFKYVPPQHLMSLPKLINMMGLNPPIYDQGEFGSCTAHAWIRMIEFIQLMLIRKGLTGPEEFNKIYTALSRAAFYYDERRVRGTTKEDAGAMLRDGSVAARKWGVCEEKLWPYIAANMFKAPSKAAAQEGLKHLIPKTVRINDGDVAALKSRLAEGFPVVFGTMLYESFQYVGSDGVVPDPDPSRERLLGGHALTLMGYDDAHQRFIVPNSWGKGWGKHGVCYMSYKYIGNAQLTNDFWTVGL